MEVVVGKGSSHVTVLTNVNTQAEEIERLPCRGSSTTASVEDCDGQPVRGYQIYTTCEARSAMLTKENETRRTKRRVHSQAGRVTRVNWKDAAQRMLSIDLIASLSMTNARLDFLFTHESFDYNFPLTGSLASASGVSLYMRSKILRKCLAAMGLFNFNVGVNRLFSTVNGSMANHILRILS